VYDTGTLEDVAALYRSSSNILKHAPAALKDMARSRDNFLGAYQAIEKGEVVVNWGVPLAGEESATDEILAYKSDAPTNGGPVLLKNGTIKTMSADQFKNAPKPAAK
jgi:hypothetical protein